MNNLLSNAFIFEKLPMCQCYYRSVFHMSTLCGHYDNRYYLATMRRFNNDLMLGQRHRWWTSIKTTLGQNIVLAEQQDNLIKHVVCVVVVCAVVVCAVVVCWSPLSVFVLSSVPGFLSIWNNKPC